MGGGPNPLRVHKVGLKSMDGQTLDLTKPRKEKVIHIYNDENKLLESNTRKSIKKKYYKRIGMAMGRGGAEGWDLRPGPTWTFLAPSSPRPARRGKFLTPSPPLKALRRPVKPRPTL